MPILVTLVLIIIVIIVIGLSSHSNHSNIVHDDSHRRSRDMTTTYTVSDKETGKVLASATIKGNSEFYALDKLLFEEEDKLSFECTTAAGMKRHLEILETAYQKSMHTIPSSERSYYELPV